MTTRARACPHDGQPVGAHITCRLCAAPLALPHPGEDPTNTWALCGPCRVALVEGTDLADRPLRPSEAARLLGVSKDSLDRWVADGYLRPETTPGGHRRFRAADIRRLLVQRAE